ncbi:hypothetical protein PF011_g14761 [Phytophthora fragariae]|uniref:Cytochrome P450 n=1 Tax=Phytophthora fragariae TaxID=53985 RepID=A0A6A3JW03_9STRA|nr:hypothetical protein PF011_g14761 [Phytophthora fragariae]
MLQSFFEDKLSYLNPVVLGLVAVAVAVAFYYTTGTTAPPTVEGEHGKVVVKRVRYLPSKIPVLGNAIELLSNAERMHDWVADQIIPFDGEPFTLRLPGKSDMMFIAKPEHIEQNTDIGLAFYTTGRLTSVWGEDALEFKPERFLDAETGEVTKVSSSKFCAFSAGPRICVGRNLAFLEMKIVIANILSRFHLVPEPGQKPAYTQGITLGMQTPLMMRVEAQNAA